MTPSTTILCSSLKSKPVSRTRLAAWMRSIRTRCSPGRRTTHSPRILRTPSGAARATSTGETRNRRAGRPPLQVYRLKREEAERLGRVHAERERVPRALAVVHVGVDPDHDVGAPEQDGPAGVAEA